MRIEALFLCLTLSLFPSALRSQDQGVPSNPGAQQDAEAAREKLLKAADQLDNIQANSEATKTSVDGMKTDVAALQASVTKLQTDNAALRQQVADLQTALDQFKAEQIKARQTLIDNVAAMMASGKDSGASKSGKKKKEAPASESTMPAPEPAQSPDTPSTAPGLAPPPDTYPPAASPSVDDDAPAPPKPQKGYYHVVASGETLTLICEAYRENGVNVSLSAIRKANGLTGKSVLKTGQKLFIPKPGT